ncbi:MAG: TPM domain-containing protein [Peptococcaceae bacterium]
MKLAKRISLLSLLLLFILNTTLWAAPELPDYWGDIYVQDFAEMISSPMEQSILKAAREIEDRTGAQISIVTLESLEGRDIETYSNELFRKWGIGDKDKENGILFLAAENEKEFRIEVGYGLEGRINDAKAGDILRNIIPYFQKGDLDSGFALAFNSLAQEISQEYPDANQEKTQNGKAAKIPWWAQLLGIALLIYLAIFHPDILMLLIYTLSRGNMGGSGGSRRGGGGSSGGGGASGGW